MSGQDDRAGGEEACTVKDDLKGDLKVYGCLFLSAFALGLALGMCLGSAMAFFNFRLPC